MPCEFSRFVLLDEGDASSPCCGAKAFSVLLLGTDGQITPFRMEVCREHDELIRRDEEFSRVFVVLKRFRAIHPKSL